MDPNPHRTIEDLLVDSKICTARNVIQIEHIHLSAQEMDEYRPAEAVANRENQ